MQCPNCKQTVEPGAAFCGNCGFQLQAQTQANPTAYALAVPAQQAGETKALLSVLCGAIGLVGSLFIPIIGVALGIAGWVLGTSSRSGSKRGLSTAGIILSSLALVAGLAVWTYAFNRDTAVKKSRTAAANGPSIVSSTLSTPCYSLNFADKLNISHSGSSCDMQAYNGDTIESSTEAYKVYANHTAVTSAADFTPLAKQAVEKDVQDNLHGYSLASEKVGAFAGSPDYVAVAVNKEQHVAVAEAVVFHQVSTGDNIFVLVHAITGDSVDFSGLEAHWQWQ